MAKLYYTTLMSLDGFIEDAEGNFDWGMPSPEVHKFVNDLVRPVGTYLFGRRLYETMAVWETMELGDLDGLDDAFTDFQSIWRTADKIVYSATLEEVWTARTTLEERFDVDSVRRLKETSATDLEIGGAALASAAFEAGLIDEIRATISPVAIGTGKPSLPTRMRLDLELLDEHRFKNGAVHLHYKVK